MSTPPPPQPPPHDPWAAPPTGAAHGYGHGYGHPGGPAFGGPPGINGFALASLLVGLLCFPPLGVVFAIVALVQISSRRERGKGLAIAGLAVSVLMSGVLALLAVELVGPVGERLARVADRGAAGTGGGAAARDVEGDPVDLEEVRAGDCFNVPGGDLLAEAPFVFKVACARPHHGEITASYLADPGAFPGDEALATRAEERCWQAQDAYAMDTWALPEIAEMYFFAPNEEEWDGGRRSVLCVLGTTEGEQRGSLKRDATMLTPGQVTFLSAANRLDSALTAAPVTDLKTSLPEYRAWAAKVEPALAAEVVALRGSEAGPPADALRKELEAARTHWQAAARAQRAEEFRAAWSRAVDATSVQTERTLRGALGLATKVPSWLEDSDGSDTGWLDGEGAGSQSV
ncbi:DUF4190 domain-containing protein [Streptomyces sp. NPDC006529]|uniref:DUF4190 domain-containing protein n=1 Tax=Streptomyces sp. NPDC006529 TaxID=3157177 RepID=UPI0033A4D4E3